MYEYQKWYGMGTALEGGIGLIEGQELLFRWMDVELILNFFILSLDAI